MALDAARADSVVTRAAVVAGAGGPLGGGHGLRIREVDPVPSQPDERDFGLPDPVNERR